MDTHLSQGVPLSLRTTRLRSCTGLWGTAANLEWLEQLIQKEYTASASPSLHVLNSRVNEKNLTYDGASVCMSHQGLQARCALNTCCAMASLRARASMQEVRSAFTSRHTSQAVLSAHNTTAAHNLHGAALFECKGIQCIRPVTPPHQAGHLSASGWPPLRIRMATSATCVSAHGSQDRCHRQRWQEQGHDTRQQPLEPVVLIEW